MQLATGRRDRKDSSLRANGNYLHCVSPKGQIPRAMGASPPPGPSRPPGRRREAPEPGRASPTATGLPGLQPMAAPERISPKKTSTFKDNVSELRRLPVRPEISGGHQGAVAQGPRWHPEVKVVCSLEVTLWTEAPAPGT